MPRCNFFRCRRCAVWGAIAALAALAAVIPACSSPEPDPSLWPSAVSLQSQLAIDLTHAEPGEAARIADRYYAGYLLETLHGDVASARTAYEEVVAEGGPLSPEIAARAALRLAELEFLAGRRRRALELTARAWSLGRDHIEIVERADRLQTRLGSLRSDGSEVRGPPISTRLESVSAGAAEPFSRAEELLRAYHHIRLAPRLERLRAGVRAKENAMEAAVRAYRAVLSHREVAAIVAAEFRIGSLYHDLALSLMFDLPPELEPRAREQLRRSLRVSAMSYLRRARAAYQRSLDRAVDPPVGERWTVAARVGLRSVSDLLGGR
ncbi:MAG: hypothetical protein MJE77_08380 [Proteobacteria bacterium]|nr:hypothetical protein [Pseudomonadota bacterium]